METIIRQALLSDKIGIWEFIKKAYGDSACFKIPDRWNWEYLENPWVQKNTKYLPIFLAIKDGEIAGQLCAVLSDIKIGDEIHHVAASCDLIVLPRWRGEGIAQRLIQAVAEHYRIYYTISCSGTTRRIFDRIEKDGYRKYRAIPTYRRLVKVNEQSVLEFIIMKTRKHDWWYRIARKGIWIGMHKIISLIANAAIKCRDLIERIRGGYYASEIMEVQRFGGEIDCLWEKEKNKFRVIIKRDQQYLNWRFSANSGLNYRKFISWKDKEARGYMVVREPDAIELDVGIIADLFAAPEDKETINGLIHHAIKFFGKSVTVIECPISQLEYQHALKRGGFLEMEKTVPIYFCNDSGIKNMLREMEDKWFISKADQDWDQLRPVERLTEPMH